MGGEVTARLIRSEGAVEREWQAAESAILNVLPERLS